MLKAIETTYKGYRFRSRLEARWAVFFDALGLKWEYEPEGFELGNGVRYLPDFWLAESRLWVEVKPTPPKPAEIEKADLLARTHMSDGNRARVAIVCGDPVDDRCVLFVPWSIDRTGEVIVVERSFSTLLSRGPKVREDTIGFPPVPKCEIFDAQVSARSARFEFGESGARV